MTYQIPKEGKFSQPNNGDIFGNLFNTLNIDLRTNSGKLKVSPRLKVITKDDDTSISNMGLPVAFASVNALTFAVTGIGTQGQAGTGKVLMNSGIDFSTFTNLTGLYATNEPTTINLSKSDAVVWNGNLYVSLVGGLGPANNIAKLLSSGPAWTLTWYTTTAGGSFQTNDIASANMFVGFNGNLYILDNDWISYVAGTGASAGNAVRPNSGTNNTTQGTLSFNGQFYPIWGMSNSDSLWVAVMTWQNAITTSGKGFIVKWDGTGTGSTVKYYDIDASCALAGTIYRDTPYIIDAYGILKKYNGTGFVEVARLPVANMNVIMPNSTNVIRNDRWIHPRGMKVVNSKINISLNNFVSTGVYVNDMPSGVWEFDPEQPEQGIYHKSSPCIDSNDYGQQLLKNVGALSSLKTSAGNYFAGFSYYTDSGSTSKYGIFYDYVLGTTNKVGSFVTTWLDASSINANFQKIFYRFRQFVLGTKIVGKYRVDKSVNLPVVISITWTSSTTFTSTDNDMVYASVLDEVEVVQGKGGSRSAHITAISVPAGTYTVTLDDTIGYTSGTAKVRINNYRKMGDITQLNCSSQFLSANKTDTNIQIKSEIRDEGYFELDDITIKEKPKQ